MKKIKKFTLISCGLVVLTTSCLLVTSCSSNSLPYTPYEQLTNQIKNNQTWTYQSALNNWQNYWNNIKNNSNQYQKLIKNDINAYLNYLPVSAYAHVHQWYVLPNDYYAEIQLNISDAQLSFNTNSSFNLTYEINTTYSFKRGRVLWQDSFVTHRLISWTQATLSFSLSTLSKLSKTVYGSEYINSAKELVINNSISAMNVWSKDNSDIKSFYNTLSAEAKKNADVITNNYKQSTNTITVLNYISSNNPLQNFISTYNNGTDYGPINSSHS